MVSQSFIAFGDILELHKKFLELSGGINRIFELEEILRVAQKGKFQLGRTWLSPQFCFKFLAGIFFNFSVCICNSVVALVVLQGITNLVVWHAACLVQIVAISYTMFVMAHPV